jgi:magnesium chelatase family protein
MSIGQTQSIALLGLTGSVVEIEVDISDGIPMYALLGTHLHCPSRIT